MYGKIFDTMYDGTLRADWQAMITLQQLIVLADQDGIIDMTIFSLHGRTGIPLDLLQHGIDYLSKPDPYSRSSTLEGRRITLLDPERNWGWEIVNYKHYRDLATREDKRQKDKVRIADKRAALKVSQGVAGSSIASEGVANVAHTDVDVDVNVNTKNTSASSDAGNEIFYLSKKKRKLTGQQLKSFNKFWDMFNYKNGKAEAADAWINLKVNKELYTAIMIGAEQEAKNRQATIDKGSTPKMAEGWLSGRRWEDETFNTVSAKDKSKDPSLYIVPADWKARGNKVNLKQKESEKYPDFRLRVLDAESVAQAEADL